MLWLIFSFLTAAFESAKDILSKKELKATDEYTIAWSLRAFSLPILAAFLILTGMPEIGERFWAAILIGGGLNILTSILYIKALKASDISATVPMLAFTPIFLLVTSPLILNEAPTILGMAGIFLIVLGSYFINLSERRKSFLAPIKALFTEKGPRLMLIVALIWSITSNIDKIGVQNSSPAFWALTVNSVIAGYLTIYLVKTKKIAQTAKEYKTLLPIGALSSFSMLFQMIAISMSLVSYVISIKRTSIIISVIGGYFIFKERMIKERIAAAIIMSAGAVIIAMSQ
ncbi:EamA family transporter [Candidatus Woesearchaeota archaeon]|nr:EamA family transporter [Candidatus Woesearchaeota archaeon]